jgi:hypothetical protein
MIILIEHSDGERYEPFQWINHIYDIDTDKTFEQIKKEYSDHVVRIMLENNITINPHWFNIMNDSKIKNKKLHKKIFNENTFSLWLEKTYKCKKIEHGSFETYMENYKCL